MNYGEYQSISYKAAQCMHYVCTDIAFGGGQLLLDSCLWEIIPEIANFLQMFYSMFFGSNMYITF